MRVDLSDDPAVITMAAKLSVSEYLIVGALHKFWSWADKHTTDGKAVGITLNWINRYIMLPDFAESLISVGWLIEISEFISIPKFKKHNGETAKTRAETKNRVKKHRVNQENNAEKCNAKVVTNALPEKRREEKSISTNVDIIGSKAANRKSRLPEDFFPNEDSVKSFHETGMNLIVELANFKNYHLAKGSVMADWQAAWRTWAANAVKFAKGKSSGYTTKLDEQKRTIDSLTGSNREAVPRTFDHLRE